MKILDTNAILRFLLRDDVERATSVRDAMEQETCFVPVEVLAEVVYVLSKTYKVERLLIQQKLSGFIRDENVQMLSQIVVETALHYFGDTKLDFVDCLLIGYALIDGHQVFTFDKELQKHLPAPTQS